MGASGLRALGGLALLPIGFELDRTQPQRVLTADEHVKRRLTSTFVQAANDCARVERDTTARQPLTQWQAPSGRLQPTTRSAIMRAPRLSRGRPAERNERRHVRSIVAC